MDHDAGVMSWFTKDMESRGMLLYPSECLIVGIASSTECHSLHEPPIESCTTRTTHDRCINDEVVWGAIRSISMGNRAWRLVDLWAAAIDQQRAG